MAKTRAQRKAERRAREARQARDPEAARGEDSNAQARTQVPESGDVAEVEAVLETGAPPEELGEHVRERSDDGPTVAPEAPPEPELEPEAPAPSRAETAPVKESRRERRQKEKERRRRARDQERRRKPAEREEQRRRGGVIGFLASCWAELKRVQWPDRETLIQASAVTVLFIAVAAAYLGALDAAFNWLVKQILY
jgi:preprotein translocase SecE subunit